MRLALYQPDIPQNAGAMLRLAACLGIAVDIVGPAGFPVSDRAFRRAGLDYLDAVEIVRHVSFQAFDEARRMARRRLVLLTTKAAASHLDVAFASGDVLMVGRESAGVPQAVREAADIEAAIPMRAGLRSLNVSTAAAIALGEALRQTDGFPRRPGWA